MSPRLLAVLAVIAPLAAQAQTAPAPTPAAPLQPTVPAEPAAPRATPDAVIPVAPGTRPASAAVDISSSRPADMPLMEQRPAATQVVPGPEATGSTPSLSHTQPAPR